MAQAGVDGAWADKPPPGAPDPLDRQTWSYRRAVSCPLGPDAEVSSLKTAATAAVAEVTGMTQRSFAAFAGTDRRETRSEALQDVTSRTAQLNVQRSPATQPDRIQSPTPAPEQKPAEAAPEADSHPATQHEEDADPESPSRHHGEQSALARSQRCPPHGIKAICGRRPRMEDAYSAIPFLLELPLPHQRQFELVPERIAPDLHSASPRSDEAASAEAARRRSSMESSSSEPWHPYLETLHFFGVFDGHGGSDAALYCAQTLHQRIVEAVNATTTPPTSRQSTEAAGADHGPVAAAANAEPEAGAAAAPERPAASCEDATPAVLSELSPSAAPEMSSECDATDPSASDTTVSSGPGISPFASNAAVPSSPPDEESPKEGQKQGEGAPLNHPLSSQESEALIKAGLADHAEQQAASESNDTWRDGTACTPQGFEAALSAAFNRVDEEFGQGESAALMGTTVVVALVGSRQLYVANCGDSRAVLCRGNVAIPLTEDHKAAREDEQARIEALGGQILYWNGVRVMGVLAVSRAVGDHCLRPFVIPKPEVTIIARRPDDELLLLASDGLWDVLSNQEAVTLAKRCLRRARQRGASRQSAARIAATVLTRAAFDRGSRDNVTVVVIDLGLGGMDQEAGDEQDAKTPSRVTGFDGGDVPEKSASGRQSGSARTSDMDA